MILERLGRVQDVERGGVGERFTADNYYELVVGWVFNDIFVREF